jgi:hypothetical protein
MALGTREDPYFLYQGNGRLYVLTGDGREDLAQAVSGLCEPGANHILERGKPARIIVSPSIYKQCCEYWGKYCPIKEGPAPTDGASYYVTLDWDFDGTEQ